VLDRLRTSGGATPFVFSRDRMERMRGSPLRSIRPESTWKRRRGRGIATPGPGWDRLLNTAASMNAYLLADRALAVGFKNRGDLSIVVEATAAGSTIQALCWSIRKAPN